MKIYLASPYSNKNATVMAQKFRAACDAAAELMVDGHIVFSPIAHSHPIATSNQLPLGFEYWQKMNHSFIDWCDAVYVLKIKGWRESKGVADEIAYANWMKKPVVYFGDCD